MVGFANRCRDLYWRDQAWLDLLFAHHRGVSRAKIFPYLREQAHAFEIGYRAAQLPRRFLRPWLTQVRSLDKHWDRLIGLIYESPEAPTDFLTLDTGTFLDFFVRCLDRFNRPLLLIERPVPPDMRERLLMIGRLKKEGWPLIGYVQRPLTNPTDATLYGEEVAATRLDFTRPDPDLFPRP
jgi:hypothetical protein